MDDTGRRGVEGEEQTQRGTFVYEVLIEEQTQYVNQGTMSIKARNQEKKNLEKSTMLLSRQGGEGVGWLNYEDI